MCIPVPVTILTDKYGRIFDIKTQHLDDALTDEQSTNLIKVNLFLVDNLIVKNDIEI